MKKVMTIMTGVVAIMLLSAFFVTGYFSKDKERVATPVAETLAKREAHAYNRHVVDTAISMLRQGNIVVRMGLGADSKLLSELNAKDQSFSHCGIVMIEHGYPFVYHAIGGEDNPDERLRRDSASFFFSPKNNAAIGIVHFSFDSVDVSRLASVVTGYYKQRPRFDMKFDLATDDKLYCSEFVYKAINKAMNDTSYIRATTLFGHRFVGIDDIFMNGHADLVWQMRFK